MKRMFLGFLLFVFLCFASASPVIASSAQAYQDYLFQFDQYRQKLQAFTVAKNEYKKFKSLTSETTAIETARAMLSQRDQLLRAYLLLLNEKLIEDRGLEESDKQRYQGLLRTEIAFLEMHNQKIPTIQSITDAERVSGELEVRSTKLTVLMQKTVIGIALGQLRERGSLYGAIVQTAKNFVQENTQRLPVSKQSVIANWMEQITNKHALYGQQYADAVTLLDGIKDTDTVELERTTRQIQLKLAQARQSLTMQASFLAELTDALRYEE